MSAMLLLQHILSISVIHERDFFSHFAVNLNWCVNYSITDAKHAGN